MNVNFSGVEFYGSRETGKKCCDCKDGPEPKPYKKFEGGASAQASITVTAPALGVAVSAPRVSIGWGLEARGVLEVGVVGRGNGSANASASYEISECKDSENCLGGSVSGGGNIEAVATVLLEVMIVRSCTPNDECKDAVGVKGETSVGLAAHITLNGSVYAQESCPAGCVSGSVGALKGVARVIAGVMVGGFYEATFSLDPDIEVWDGFTFGGACGG